MSDSKVEFLFLSKPDMIEAGVLDMAGCVDTLDEAFAIMGQGDYLMGGPSRHEHGVMLHFPEEPLGPRMPTAGPDRRFMAMISYLGGDYHLCGTKWYGSNAANPKRGLPRSILLVIINDPDTGGAHRRDGRQPDQRHAHRGSHRPGGPLPGPAGRGPWPVSSPPGRSAEPA